MSGPRLSRGLGALAALVVLVLLALLAAAVVRLSQSSQGAIAQEVQAARAQAAARGGIEWGLHMLLKGGWAGCVSQSQTLDLRFDSGTRVTVSCTGQLINEGELAPGVPRTVRVYHLTAVACNGSAASCPDNAAAGSPQYVERRREVTVSQ